MNPSHSSKLIPPRAWDTHQHIFEPDLFPLASSCDYNPYRASLADLQAFERTLGIEHVCIAHGFSYGSDCTSLLYYLQRFEGRARGTRVLDLEDVTVELLEVYHVAGARSTRLNFFQHRAINDVDVQIRLIMETAQRLVEWKRNSKNNWSI